MMYRMSAEPMNPHPPVTSTFIPSFITREPSATSSDAQTILAVYGPYLKESAHCHRAASRLTDSGRPRSHRNPTEGRNNCLPCRALRYPFLTSDSHGQNPGVQANNSKHRP